MNMHCTCKDTKCPNHPSNHDNGCTLCIIKNLKRKEIPSCFFNMLDGAENVTGYGFEDFAKLVLQNGPTGTDE